jgi:hypothetical protein
MGHTLSIISASWDDRIYFLLFLTLMMISATQAPKMATITIAPTQLSGTTRIARLRVPGLLRSIQMYGESNPANPQAAIVQVGNVPGSCSWATKPATPPTIAPTIQA